MRTGFSGPGVGGPAPGVTIGSILANADMAAADRLLEVAAELYVYDDTGTQPFSIRSARSVAAGNSGGRTPAVAPILFNGSTYDPQVNNREGTLLALAARTATTTTPTQTNYGNRGVLLILDVSAKAAATTLVVTIQPMDPVQAGQAADLATSGAFAAAAGGVYNFLIGPGQLAADAVAPTIVKALRVGRSWRAYVTPSDANSVTYSLGFQYL